MITNTTKPTKGRNRALLWLDPDKETRGGVLLSDRIRFYADQIGLIDIFSAKNLGPASYDLTLGAECWFAKHTRETGEIVRFLAENEKLIIPPNSIVFVSTAESLNLPFYLTARFNLKLRFLHEGLLVGTGPQIDPGFAGRLSCPLHNISNSNISISRGETFAVIEFQKTTPFAQRDKLAIEMSLEEIRKLGEAFQLKGIDGNPCLTFPSKSLNRKPIVGYMQPGKVVASSVDGVASDQAKLQDSTQEALDEFKKELNRLSYFAYITVAVVAVSMASYFIGMVNFNRTTSESTIRAEEQIKTLSAKVNALEISIKAPQGKPAVIETNALPVSLPSTNAISNPTGRN